MNNSAAIAATRLVPSKQGWLITLVHQGCCLRGGFGIEALPAERHWVGRHRGLERCPVPQAISAPEGANLRSVESAELFQRKVGRHIGVSPLLHSLAGSAAV